MEMLAFGLRPIGLSGVNELCTFLADLERRNAIRSWQFGRHTDQSRMTIMVGFTNRQDADLAAQAWRSRPLDEASSGPVLR